MKRLLSLAVVSLLATAIARAQDPASSYPSRTIRSMGLGTGSTAVTIKAQAVSSGNLPARWTLIIQRAGIEAD